MMAFSHVHVARPSGYGSSVQWCGPAFAQSSRRGEYGDAMTEMDWVVGQIVKQVRALGVDNNTLIIFASDNGPWLTQGLLGGTGGLFYEGKGSTFEGGIRSPGFLYWPGRIAPGSVLLPAVSLMDFFPTLAQLSGASLPQVTLDGRSLVPVVWQSAAVVHEYLFFYNMVSPGNHTICAVRNGPHKVYVIP